MRPFLWFLFLPVLPVIFLNPWDFLLSQGQPERSGSSPSSPEHSNAYANPDPLKYEEGDVTIDLRLASENLKRQAEQKFQLLNSILANREKSEERESIQRQLNLGNTAFLRGDYTNSRRHFRSALDIMDSQFREVNMNYRILFEEYTEILNNEIWKFRQDRSRLEGNQNLLPYLEKQGIEAGEFYRKGEFHSKASRNLAATPFYQKSLQSLLAGIIRARQEWERKIIPEDHLEAKDKKIWDEVRGFSFREMELVREQRRKELQERLELRRSSDKETRKSLSEAESSGSSSGEKDFSSSPSSPR